MVDTQPKVLQYFGIEDIVISHTQLLIDLEEKIEINTTPNGEKNMRKRCYNV